MFLIQSRNIDRLWSICRQLARSSSGASAIGYGLLAGLMALGVAGGFGALADLINQLFDIIINGADQVSETLDSGEAESGD